MEEDTKITLPADWAEALGSFLKSDAHKQLKNFLDSRYAAGINIYPKKQNIFKAFRLTPFSSVRVVILGQDPYPADYASGLAFGVRSNIPRPPSLRNIFKELENNFNRHVTKTQNTLEGWAEQGVLLLNTCLTVEEARPGSHVNKGWEKFTDHVIEQISEHKKGVIFVLWGNHAQSKEKLIKNRYDQAILTAAHPSPLSANSGFFGCNHFSEINSLLRRSKGEEIDWFRIDRKVFEKDVISDIVESIDLERGLKGG